ncbi:hypothetical protein C5167_031449 [Papaver somniferum]|uniref:Uncharacterized protein n=1 Tax=Papaver somniferum TaxID=3469 RepID=A0A4Y7K784_PAPSO|nr:hypothetical protein C5167_031449 [Papaver somniferum]
MENRKLGLGFFEFGCWLIGLILRQGSTKGEGKTYETCISRILGHFREDLEITITGMR